MRCLRADDVARRHQLERFVIADETRQKVCTAAIRHQADLDEDLTKERLLRCDDEIAREREVAADADRVPMHARNDGDGQ